MALSTILFFILLFSVFQFHNAELQLTNSTTRRLNAFFPWEFNPLMRYVDTPGWYRLRNLHKDVQDNGCDINLCFLLEATRRVTAQDFLDQKNFADLMISITTTDKGGNFCAAMYNAAVTPISWLTGNKIDFLKKLQGAIQPVRGQQHGLRIANLFSALRFGVRALRPGRGDANKIIAFSKKRPILYGRRSVDDLLWRFRNRGGGVCAVALRKKVRNDLIALTGDPNLVVSIEGYFDLAEVIVATVADVCSMPCKTRYGIRGRRRRGGRRRGFRGRGRRRRGPGARRRRRRFRSCPPPDDEEGDGDGDGETAE